MSSLKEHIVHRFLRVPYTLHVTTFRAPRNPRATVILLHGIGNNAHAWDDLIPLLPRDIRIIGLDLLGFGRSPKPSWIRYNARQQARAVSKTLLQLGLTQRVTIVGHSLGSLVAVELAKWFPFAVQQLLLCSPPFYKEVPTSVVSRDKVLKDLYKIASKSPEQLVGLSPIFVKLGIADKTLKIDESNVYAYANSLTSSIVNQTALEDAKSLRIPTRILYGAFDSVVIEANIKEVARASETITSRRLLVTHEMGPRYMKIAANELKKMLG